MSVHDHSNHYFRRKKNEGLGSMSVYISKQILKELILNCYMEQNTDKDGEGGNLARGSGGPKAPGERL